MRLRRPLLALLLLIFALVLGTLAGIGWLLGTDSGFRAVGRWAPTLSGGRLQMEGVEGRLAGAFRVTQLRWQSGETRVEIDALAVDWQARHLLDGQVDIARIAMGDLRIQSPARSTPPLPITEIRLPLAVEIRRASIEQLEYNGIPVATDLAARARSDGRHFRLEDVAARVGDVDLRGEAQLDGASPTQLAASATITGRLADKPLNATLTAAGPLSRIDLALTARQGLSGSGQAMLTPFAATPFERASLQLDHLDLAAWKAAAPRTDIRIRADIAPKGHELAGSAELVNALPGRLDLARLPLSSLALAFTGNRDAGQFSGLKAVLAGQGEITGRGAWQDKTARLDAQVRGLNLAALHSRLLPTRLQGPIRANADARQQTASFDLKDARFNPRLDAHFALLGELSRAGDTLTIRQLALTSGEAQLTAEGTLELSGARAFSLRGALNRFDPRRFGNFATLPAAQLNARLRADGQLTPKRKIDVHADLADSRLAGQPLQGRVDVKIDDRHLRHADIELTAGANRLKLLGAFGRPGDHLALDLDAPELAPYGGEGGIQGKLTLAGSLPSARLNGWIRAARLGWPGLFRLRGLDLQADLGTAADAPLKLDAAIETLESANQPALARALRLHAEGSNRDQRIRLNADLLGKNRVTLAAAGRYQPASGWQGELQDLQLASADKQRNFHLERPAPLTLSADRWQFGPLPLRGETLDWRAVLNGQADRRQFALQARGDGGRLGQLRAELNGATAGSPWAIARDKPWRGSLLSETPDLAWLGEILGENWQSGGALHARIDLGGTPSRPLASGQVSGERLTIAQAALGLRLENGHLDVALRENLLQVQTLHFDSRLTRPPSALRQAAGNRFDTPGSLDVRGELRLSPGGEEDAWLDIRLARFGVFQQPDQWVAVSGKGRLEWRERTLGVRGELAADAGYWQLAPSGAPRLSDDVVVRRAGDEVPSATLRPQLDLDLLVDLGDNFRFVGAGLSSQLAGKLRLTARGRDLPRATGTIRAEKGRYQAYGQDLDIERAHLVFNGLLGNPALDVRAMRRGLAVEAGVQIAGTARKPLIKLVSVPDVPDAEKLAWLVVGHGPEQMGAGDATVLLSAAGALLGNNAGGLTRQLKEQFGFEDVGIRQGRLGEATMRTQGSRVAGLSNDTAGHAGNQIFSVSKRLSQNLLLSYEQVLGKAENIVKLTFKLSRRVSLVGRAGSDNALDIFYSFSFGGAPKNAAPPEKR